MPGTFSNGFGINIGGTAVGNMTSGSGIGSNAFVIENGSATDIGHLISVSFGRPPINTTTAYDVNDQGQITGVSNGRAFLYDHGQWTYLGDNAAGYAINNRGQVTGEYQGFAFIATDRFVQLLGSGMGLGINNNGQVVGKYSDMTGRDPDALLTEDDYRAFISDGSVPGTVDLNTLIVGGFGGTLLSAEDINDSGQIVANGINAAGEHRAFLLTPVPVPAAVWLFGSALLGLGGFRVRSKG